MASSVSGALKKRRFKPMFFLDAAVPKDVDSAVGKLDGAYLFTLDDLERIALKGQEQRTRAAIEARLIVDDAVENFMQAEAVRMAAPLVVALRGHFEAMRAEILAENPDVTAQEATQLLINRLLHGPYRALRKMGGSVDDGESLPEAELLSRLFGLEKDKD
jgi:glutamyl-tRNA reductase